MDNRDIVTFKNLLLKENMETPLREMAKIQGPLKDAIEAVITGNPDLDGLALKKAIKGDAGVIAALGEEDLYDNQLNKFIGNTRGTRTLQTRGRKPAEQETPTASPFSMASLSEPDGGEVGEEDDFADDFSFDSEGPSDDEIDTSFDSESSVSSPTSNNFRNIISKKVSKIENLGNPNDLAALKQFIKNPKVVQALGADTIRDLVSSVIR